MTKDEMISIVRQIVLGIFETIQEAGPNGAPEGPLYMAFMTATKLGHDEWSTIVEAMIASGRVKRSNHVLYAT